ncbi:tetratricopeptide repeat protein [Actinomadura sp. J1-007]|nr:tetratricopeptide repeat protein [Actinomadura sp. J1-007]
MGALLEVEDYDGVAETAQRAVTSGDPETVFAGYWLWGDARRHGGDSDAAVRLYRHAIDAADGGDDPAAARVRIDLARALRDRDRRDEASAELERALRSDEPDVRLPAGNLLGAWAFEDGDLEAAAEAFGRAAAVDAEDERVAELAEMAAKNVIVVANKAFSEGVHRIAVRALALAARAGYPEDALRMAGKRAAECAGSGDRDAAMLYVEGAAAFLDDPGPDLQIQLADLYVSAGLPERARAAYERLADHPDAEIRLVATGRLVPLLREAAETERLAPSADRTAEQPLDPSAQALLGSVLGMLRSEQGDEEGALRTLRAAAETGAPAALFALGQELVEQGRMDEARDVLARIPEDSRVGRRTLVVLGNTHHDSDPARARDLYLRALDGPGEPDAHAESNARMYLGSLGKQARDWPEALRWYQRVIDAGDEQAALAAAHLGELAYWLGDRGSAIRFYELTLATGTTQADLVGEAAYRLGELRHADGDLAEARAHLQRAADSGDESFAAEARALLSKLRAT